MFTIDPVIQCSFTTTMQSFRRIPPFSNNAPIPASLRVLVAQTPIMDDSQEDRGQQPLLAQQDMSEPSQRSGVPSLLPVIYTVKPVANFASESKMSSPDLSKPSSPSPRDSLFSEDDYVSFLPMPTEKREVHRKPGNPDPAPAKSLRSERDVEAVEAVKTSKPKGCASMTEQSLAKAWGQTPERLIALKVIPSLSSTSSTDIIEG